jgi:SAM-dependent methyltransferase
VYSVNNKSVIIWGLAGCNCEALAVWAGADKVYVVDYNKPVCDNEKIEVMNHEEILNAGIKTDFAVSYSSFEHDGLGRYGDPLSPDGDLRAMQEAHKFLKKDGILFFGVPLGQDCLVWNGHRIYGKIRLPLLLKGWQLLDVFDVYNKDTAEYPFDLELGTYIQNVLVLRKIDKDYPDDEYLTKPVPANTGDSNAKNVLQRINGVIHNHI